MPREKRPADSAGSEEFVLDPLPDPDVETSAAPAPTEPESDQRPAAPAPFVPSYRVGTFEGERVVFRTTESNGDEPLTPQDRAPAEAWAELLGHVNPGEADHFKRDVSGKILGERRFAMSDYKRHLYEAARVQWGQKGPGGAWTPGASGKEMTRREYEAFVKKGQGAVGR